MFGPDHAALIGIAVGVLILVYLKLVEISRTLNRIEILLQEAAREADRVIRERKL